MYMYVCVYMHMCVRVYAFIFISTIMIVFTYKKFSLMKNKKDYNDSLQNMTA